MSTPKCKRTSLETSTSTLSPKQSKSPSDASNSIIEAHTTQLSTLISCCLRFFMKILLFLLIMCSLSLMRISLEVSRRSRDLERWRSRSISSIEGKTLSHCRLHSLRKGLKIRLSSLHSTMHLMSTSLKVKVTLPK